MSSGQIHDLDSGEFRPSSPEEKRKYAQARLDGNVERRDSSLLTSAVYLGALGIVTRIKSERGVLGVMRRVMPVPLMFGAALGVWCAMDASDKIGTYQRQLQQ